MIDLHLRAKWHVFITGSSGTGKSVIVANVLKTMTAS